MKSDERLISIVKQNKAIIENTKNAKEAILVIIKLNPTKEDLDKFSVLLGFKNFNDYSKLVHDQDEILIQLKEEYQLNKVNQNLLKNICIEALNFSGKLNKMSSLKGSIIQVADGDNCERIRRNCLIEVAATATAAHIACVSADLTVVLGIIYHGAAIAYQAAAGDTCNAEAENCNGVVSHD